MTDATKKQHRLKISHPELWRAVSGAVQDTMNCHPEMVIPTPDSITKRVVGQVLALQKSRGGESH